MKYFFIVIFIFFISCEKPKEALTAQQIIDKAMSVSGANKINSSKISFDFREIAYQANRKNGIFQLKRSFDSITDVLSNRGFQRFVNGIPIKISDSLANVYSNSVNAVHYFSVLPFGLNDAAVHKKLIPSTTIFGKNYYKIKITFSKNGGGEDFEDVFVYWIEKEHFTIDYVAYSFFTNGGGKRFRVVKNSQNINGIRFVNWDNYQPKNSHISLVNLDIAFQKNQLKKVSEIELRNIKVTYQ